MLAMLFSSETGVRKRLWTYAYGVPRYFFFNSNVYEIQFSRYMRMTSRTLNKLCELLAPYLHSEDNRFRDGIKGEEWFCLALS